MSNQLDAPKNYSALYHSLGEECREFDLRPVFTGDVFKTPDAKLWAVVQHPCTFSNGAAGVLVAEVVEGSYPSQKFWQGNFKKMFLPEVGDLHFEIMFGQLGFKRISELDAANRIVLLSNYGVNVLMQRWIYHNARVLVATSPTIHDSTSGVFEETEMLFEAEVSCVEAGRPEGEGIKLVTKWLDEDKPNRRGALDEPQLRPALRQELSALVKTHLMTA